MVEKKSAVIDIIACGSLLN